MNAPDPQRTPLHASHVALGARMVDFAGWSMPVYYKGGILSEHHATRNAIGVFDTSHMGEVHFRGPRAEACVQRIVTNDVGKLRDGAAQYAVACHEHGGIVDDLIVYRVKSDHFLIVVNASNIQKDIDWFRNATGTGCDIEDALPGTAMIAFQGPQALSALETLCTSEISQLPSFHFATDVHVAGLPCWVARTGYTGEDGIELFTDSNNAPKLWDALIDAATARAGGPAGLGARDTLRMEARLSLYGNDLDDTTTPLEAGLGWVVKFDAGEFIGKSALLAQKQAGLQRTLVGFVMRGRGIGRHGYPILSHPPTEQNPAEAVGIVTSGGPGPTVGKNIGMGYIPTALAAPGTQIFVDCRGKITDAEVLKGPFYKRP